MIKLGTNITSNKSSGQFRSNGDTIVRLLAIYDNTLGNITDTVSIWVKGSGNAVITWNTGVTEDITLTGTLTEYSHTYTDEDPIIYITNSSNTTELVLDLTDKFTIDIEDLNPFTTLTSFININSVITGDVSLITLETLKIVNLGYQVDNTLLIGDIGEILNNNLYTIFSVNGGEFTYSETVTQVEEDSNIILENTNLSNAEIDQILIDLEGIGTDSFELIITGNNGYKTATSDTEYDQLITNGCTIELNNQPITSISYSNTGQTFTEDVAITPMILTSIPDVSANQVLEFFGTLPTGLSINSTTGEITGTPTVVDETMYVVRCRAYGTYTGFADVELTFDVQVGVVPLTYNINLGSSVTIANTEDPNNKYWNMLFGTSGTVSNIVDEDNSASSIDVAIIDAFDAVSDFDGRQPTDLVYPNKAWRAVMTISAGTGVVEISSLPNTSYTVILGVSRNTTGTRIGLYTVNGASQTLDAILNPPQTVTFTGVVPSTGVITITTAINSGSIAAHLNFIKIIG